MPPRSPLLALLVAALAASSARAGLVFNFTPTPGLPAQVAAGFEEAAGMWSSLLADDVTINLDIDFRPMGGSVLGETASERRNYTYANLLNRITDDRTSVTDFQAVSTLDVGSAFDMRINYTSNNPHGAGSPLGYLDNDGDANNTTIRATTANAKALGLRSADNPNSDGRIEFNSNFNWDFDRSNGITPGTHDFVGVALHEIGHVLGFNSGVGTLDANSPDPQDGYLPDDWFTYVHVMDLFRYSTQSVDLGVGVIDYTAGTLDKYFSLDGGVTKIASFSTGTQKGDGRQTSHWKDHLGIGLMDPTISSGTLGQLTANDLLLFDAIGWDLAGVPEPAMVVPLTLALLALRRPGTSERGGT